MAITFITRDYGVNVSIVRITTTSTLAQASTAGYITAQAANIAEANNGAFEWLSSDMTLVNASDGWMFANISSDFSSLEPMVFSTTVTGTPVIVGHIAVFSSTGGNISQNAATAINGGNIQAGLSGTAGTLASFPGTAANGSLIISALNAGGAFNTTIRNSVMGQSSVISIPDPGAATSEFVLSQSTAPTNNVTFTKVITASAAALATAGKVNIQVHPSATSQFAVLDVKVLKSTGLSGGGGDRLLALSDGTIVFNNAGITAALLGTPILTLWGGTGNPLAVGASEISTAGADIFLQYSGGAADFTTGSVQVAVTLVQVTA